MQGTARSRGFNVNLKKSETVWRDFQSRIGPGLANITGFAEHLAHSALSDKETIEEIFKHLEASAGELITVEKEAEGRCEILGQVKNAERDMRDGAEEIDLEEMYKDLVESRKATWQGQACGEHESIKTLKQLRRRAIEEEDEEDELLVAGGSANVDKCPITRANMEDPLKNSTCVHVFSTAGIVSLIAQANRISVTEPYTLDQLPMEAKARCPVAPCPHHVSRMTLKRDYATELTQRQNLASQMVPHDEEDVAEEEEELII